LWKTLVDASQLENALLNLCVNARDAMPKGGSITLVTSNVTVAPLDSRAAEPGIEFIQLSVVDTGTGMSAHVMRQAFDPFFTTKEAGKGSGLGLSMVYGFVRQSGGTVWIESEPGQGTSVHLRLPRCVTPVAIEERPLVSTDPAPRGTETVLVVEDDELVRVQAIAVLEDLGYAVIAAHHAGAALDVLRNGQRVDLVFTDVVMPGGINGAQLASEARQLRPNVGVLLTSGYSDALLQTAGSGNGAFPLLSKPYRRLDLAKKVREVLDTSA
jgi:CheY-like chemotaxis protein